MCGSYVQVSSIEVLEKRFCASVEQPERLKMNPNVAPGDLVPVITHEDPGLIVLQRFGLTPAWATSKQLYINARAETVLDKPSFRVSIRRKRCIILADAFYEGSENQKLNKPYLMYLVNKERPFSFAGIWDEWVHSETGEPVRSFAILTTSPNRALQTIGHPRSPVILEREQESVWLSSHTPLTEAMSLLRPCRDERMNAYPVSSQVKNAALKDLSLLNPTGDRLFPESEYISKSGLSLRGMGRRER